ncbi:TonB-dependent receptor [Bowmanella dokdonensis]|uniref:TonB-dependent receptor n=1 Tax=Bowmanella dokdonensis TaxID=751969 RepID=A0A939DN90_9ALTE|nr:TonB-dependent receptor [Bowmanella dokdonensis]MBN7825342.1 TonB-dependent receptor [Bowmanella dokdonensis]
MSAKYLIPLMGLSFVSQADQQDIERVSVTATRGAYPVSTVPAAISVISQEDIQAQLAHTQDLSQILGNLLPSFSPSRQKLTSAGETLRGREPLYMIDGVPQSNPLRNGSRDGKTIDPAMIERIEVIRGANAIQGMGASGGIINIITKSAGGKAHQVSLGFSAPTSGGSDSQSFKSSYLFSHEGEQTELVAGVSLASTGMYRDGNGDLIGVDGTQGDTQDSDSQDFFVKVKHALDAEQSIQLMVNHYDIQGNGDYVVVNGDVDAGVPTSAERGEIQGGAPQNKVTTASLDYQNDNLWGGQLTWQWFLQDFAALYGGGTFGTFQDPSLGENIYDQSQNKSTKLGSRLTWFKQNLGGTDLDLVTGLDWLNDETFQELALTGRKWVPEAKFNNLAPFAQLRYDGLEDWVFNLGARYEYGKLKVDDFTTLASYGSAFVEGGEPSFNELLSNLGVVYQITPELRVFASYSEGFSMPDVGRVLRGINQPGLSVASFLSLQPVVSDNREIGLDYANNWLSVQTSYFQSDSDLGSRLQADADGIYSVEREKTEISGFEAQAQFYFGASSVGINYARTQGRYDGDDDGVVDSDLGGANISPERLNLYWQHAWNPDLSSRVQLNKLFDMTFEPGEDFEGYLTLDASLRYDHGQWGSFTLGLENLTDKQYITYYGQTNPAPTRYFPGMGRTVSLTWQLAF